MNKTNVLSITIIVMGLCHINWVNASSNLNKEEMSNQENITENNRHFSSSVAPKQRLVISPEVLQQKRQNLNHSTPQSSYTPSIQLTELDTIISTLKPHNHHQPKPSRDIRINSLAQYYSSNNRELNQCEAMRFGITAFKALKDVKDHDYSRNVVFKSFNITAKFVEEIGTFLEKFNSNKLAALEALEEERRSIYESRIQDRSQSLEALDAFIKNHTNKANNSAIRAAALIRQKQLALYASDLRKTYEFNIPMQEIIHQALPYYMQSVSNKATPAFSLYNILIKLHHQGILEKAPEAIKHVRKALSDCIYNPHDTQFNEQNKRTWENAKIITSEDPKPKKRDKAIAYFKDAAEKRSRETGVLITTDQYITKALKDQLSFAAYPDLMIRAHNDIMFQLKQDFKNNNPVLRNTVIQSVLVRPKHNKDLIGFNDEDFSQESPTNELTMDERFTDKDPHRFPLISLLGAPLLVPGSKGPYEKKPIIHFEENMSNTEAHSLHIAQHKLTTTSHLWHKSRKFSFLGVSATAGFIYVPSDDANDTPTTQRAFFGAEAKHRVYGGTIRREYTVPAEIKEFFLVEGSDSIKFCAIETAEECSSQNQ